MNTKFLPVFLIALCLTALTACTVPLNSDPILAVGHGAFIGADGKELIPSAEFISSAQRYYISALLKDAAASREKSHLTGDAIRETQKRIYSLVKDEILANALFTDWLIEKIQPDNLAHVTSINNALRWHYVLHIQRESILPKDNVWTKGIDPEIAKELEGGGITVFLVTKAGGEEYVRQCRNAGVPVPEAMFSAEWNFQGIIDNEFLSDAWQAELWRFTSTSPAGVCLALPRYPNTGGGGFSDEAALFGIICLGTQSNKSCFFDNPKGKTFTRNVEVSINEFVGGVDLVANGQGVCSDCHAGENPYVIHPETPAFSGLASALLPSGWPDPLVDASWPQNPGPSNLLDAVAATGRCDSCHQVGSAGRFPEVSTQLPGYCGTVLATAVGLPPVGPSAKETMPPFGLSKSQYTAHINALQAACGAPPSTGVVVDVDFPDDNGHISPPLIIDPLYQCATQVAVRGAILDAKVELFINGASVGSLIARNPAQEAFNVPSLVVGDIVTAKQEFNGALSGPSAPVTVRDHTVDFPASLPAPVIDPTLIYQCANTIAVRHVPGANVTVFSNGGTPRSYGTSTGWTIVGPGKQPFDVGDTYTVTAELCGDVSPASAPQNAVTAPATLPAPTFNPPTVYAGQELVTVESLTNGARTSMAEASFGSLSDFSTPISWFPNYDVATRLGRPLAAGDQLLASPSLCTKGSTTQTQRAEDCSALPAPRIQRPLASTNYVVVTQAVPGARIRVYDNSGKELGDGSGTVITLNRTLTGVDILTVVQQLGDCTSSTGYRISAGNPRSSDNQ